MQETPPRTARKIWIIIGVTFAFLVATFLIVTRDIDPVDDSDLALAAREIAPDQNPYPEIRDFDLTADQGDRIDALKESDRNGDPIDEAELSSLLKELAPALERFSRYAAMTEWEQDRELSIESTVPYLTPWMELALLKRLESQRKLRAGEIEGALDDSLEILRFGRGLQQSRGSLIHYLVGQAIANFGYLSLTEIIQSGELDADDLARINAVLDETAVVAAEFTEVLKREYQTFKAVIADLQDGDIDLASLTGSGAGSSSPSVPSPLTFKRNKTILLFADAYRQMIEEVPLVRADSPKLAFLNAEDYEKNRWRYVASGNVVGHIFYSMAIPAIDGMLDRFALQGATHDLLAIQVALERYRQETGEFPSDLETLVPRYLDAIPLDRFDGQPLRYDPEAGRIYSVGQDYQSQGGVAPDKPGTLKSRKEVVIELRPGNTSSEDPESP